MTTLLSEEPARELDSRREPECAVGTEPVEEIVSLDRRRRIDIVRRIPAEDENRFAHVETNVDVARDCEAVDTCLLRICEILAVVRIALAVDGRSVCQDV
eukprot:gnl/TRDRNA2_/TRDRNA2_117393_c1_seq1.p2 gnl/TRDRNA2_/TRDRNA2_117393_c1~~gnl/TRDRNA2_/TRDRNA2_117393_c1_seq1.p2  ORF type:complete len:100 (-),score=9.81 gnl/TRDRNA2_/TRDRNA2_117393_c1_seq1:173-472(-)